MFYSDLGLVEVDAVNAPYNTHCRAVLRLALEDNPKFSSVRISRGETL